MVYARALASAAVGLVLLLGFYGTQGEPAPRQLHPSAVAEYAAALPECADVWSNAWCQARKSEGLCHEVMLKCMGTCGGCCIDDLGHEQCEQMLADEVCHVQATGGYGNLHTTDCLETCGLCRRELPVACSFEDGEEGQATTGNNEQAACLLDRTTPTATGTKFTLKSFGNKKWTGPRYAADREWFAVLDSETRASGDEAWLTTPWGSVGRNQIVTFEYSMYTRDFPDAMGTLEVEALVSHENKGYRPIWSSSTAHTALEWHTGLVEVGEEACSSDHAHDMHDVHEDGTTSLPEMDMHDMPECFPLRLRFRAITGAPELSDIAMDNIQLLTRVCGDGVRTYEACDDGNLLSGDGCSGACEVEAGYGCFKGAPGSAGDSCTLLGCGDGILTGAETCDDSNMMDGDGCSAACQVEAGHWCDHEPGTELDHTKPELGQYHSYPGPSTCEMVYEGKPRLVGLTAPYTSEPHELDLVPLGPGDGTSLLYAGVLEIYSAEMSQAGEYKAAPPGDSEFNDALATVACREMGWAVGRVCKDTAEMCEDWEDAHFLAEHADKSLCSADMFASEKACRGHLPAADASTCEVGGAQRADGSYVSKAEMEHVKFACPDACMSCTTSGATRRGTWDHYTDCEPAEVPVGEVEKPIGSEIARDCVRTAPATGETAPDVGLYVQCYHPNTCGDGKRSPHQLPPTQGALCDDGNIDAGDGCGADCTVEQGWHCGGGSWTSRDSCVKVDCGDGLRVATEGCDDGNAVAGDGCSPTCQVEAESVCVGMDGLLDGDMHGLSDCYAVGTLKLKEQPTLSTAPAAGEPIVGSAPLLVMSEQGWGSVCLRDFGIRAATVACQDLANTWLGGRSWYVQSPGFRAADVTDPPLPPTRLEVTCAGTEATLMACGDHGLREEHPVRCLNERVHLTCSTDP